MKSTLPAILFIALLTLFMTINQSFAQASDTVAVFANPPGTSEGKLINDFINGDTTSTGQRNNPNRVYVLQQTGSEDTTYYITSVIETKYNLTIIGKKNPITGKIPVIEAFINPDNSSPTNFVKADSGSKVTFQNIYFLATRTDGVSGLNTLLTTSGQNVRLSTDYCVYENFGGGNMFANNGDHFKFFAHNNEFRNLTGVFWQGGSVLWSNAGAIMDTVEFVNNTFFCVTRAVYGTPMFVGYLNFNHNTSFLGVGGAFLAPQISNAVITNNIFYGLMAHGADSSYIKAGSANSAHQGLAVVMIDTLSSLLNPPYSLTEAQRNITVSNNAYCWPPAFYTYWKSVSDTAKNHPGLITPPAWMNARTVQVFSDKTRWPGCTQANNDSIDPGFATSLTGPAIDSCLHFVNLIWTATPVGAFRWGQLPADPFGVTYPVPENLRYSNTSMQSAGTDGKALGDLNWFPEQITSVKQESNNIPTRFVLSQNFPNPFNPSTSIKFTIPENGFVTLKVFNILGQQVAVLFQSYQKAGSYNVNFDASKLSSGVYLYRLQSNNYIETKKMTLLK
jgi:hypothetical protein